MLKTLTPVTAGILLGLLFVWLSFGGKKTEFDKLGLGIGTSAVYQDLNGRKIHCGEPLTVPACLQPDKNLKNRIVLLGWSQLHGINQYQEGQDGAPRILARNFKKNNIDFLTFSQGNANPREHFVFMQWLRTRTNFNGLVIGAWMQGMREEGLRSSIQDLVQDKDTQKLLEQTDNGLAIVNAAATAVGKPETSSTQEKVENAMVGWLEEHIPLWDVRAEAEGQTRLFFRNIKSHIIRLRDLVLGLDKSQWIWPIPPARYEQNIGYLEAIVSTAEEAGIDVLIYIPPRPVDFPFPFDPDTYARFKTDVSAFAKKHGAGYANLEDCVSGDVWGETRDADGSLTKDITHFTASGHAQLARCLEPEVRKSIKAVR